MYMKNMNKPRNVTRRKRGTRTKQRGGGILDNLKEKLNPTRLKEKLELEVYKVKSKFYNTKNEAENKIKKLFGNQKETQPATISNPANSANPEQQGGLKRKHRTQRRPKASMNKRTKRAKRTRSRK
jgi:hypothetical protein